MRTLPEDWQQKLDDFNAAQGGPSRIEICWDLQKERWSVWAVPVQDSHHPRAYNKDVQKLLRRFPDESGRMGIRVFDWCERNIAGEDSGFRPLDDRIFEALHWADSFADSRHFENRFVQPELQREIEEKKAVREIAYAAKSYWRAYDSLTVGPHSKGGDWRWRIR